jgi:hypothetical protein
LQILVFSEPEDYHGRESLMEFLRQRQLSHRSYTQLLVKPSFSHVIGEAIWMEYEFRINIGGKAAISHGSALWSDADGEWRIAHLNLGTRPGDPVTIPNH